MPKLNFKTRGMSSPQGKPKVYFTCHPADFALYFETITDEILKSQNCAIWYDEELVLQDETGRSSMPRGEGTILADLGDMQLIVIPVTSRFLYQDCRARTVEFAFAMEHHIPVLPLMQERGLESEFNRICGDLQFLDRNNCDDTTDTYEEKLHKFLSSVLVDDETAAKVRAAFDAYVFLSYRKKDRKYAKELMRLIHSNDFCRDIAIWYDEYLTPGENFNDAIRDAMERSRLFTLMVTPNLVNEINYVMTVEYPAAKDAGKPVLPVEVEETSEEALKENYEGIPDCVKSQEQEELARRLAEHLRDLAVRENDSDPQHIFFIGLAYLAGIDVEVDHERAQEMITMAAEEGLDEAIEKLVSMYRTGEGVARDYHEAVRWQEELVEVREERYDESGSAEDAEALFVAMCSLGDFLFELRQIEEAKDVYDELKGLAEAMRQFENMEKTCSLSASYLRLGLVFQAEGDLYYAEKYYEEFQGHSYWLSKEGVERARRDLALSYRKIGEIKWIKGIMSQARENLENALKISEELCEETGTTEARRDLAVCYAQLGNLRRDEGIPLEARAYFEKGLAICEELCEELGTVESRRDLSLYWHRLGYLDLEEGNLPEAKAYFEKCRKINAEINEEIGTAESRRDLSLSDKALGELYMAGGELSEARKYFERCLKIRELLWAETGAAESRRDLSVSYIDLGDLCIAERRLPEARAYYRRSLELRLQLYRDHISNEESRRGKTEIYGRMGDICREEGNQPKAMKYYMRAMENARSLYEDTGMWRAYREMAMCYMRLGDFCRETGNLSEARGYYEEVLDILKTLSKYTPKDKRIQEMIDHAQAALDSGSAG